MRTGEEFMEILDQEVSKLINKETTVGSVSAIVNAFGKMVTYCKTQMDYCKQLGKTPHIPFLGMGNKKK